MHSLGHKISYNERVFLQEAAQRKTQQDTKGKIGTQLLWQTVHIVPSTFTIDSTLEGGERGRGRKNRGEKKHCTCLRTCPLQGLKMLRDPRANTLHRSTLLVLWKFALSITMG